MGRPSFPSSTFKMLPRQRIPSDPDRRRRVQHCEEQFDHVISTLRDVLLVLRQQLGVIANLHPTTHYILQNPQPSIEGVPTSSGGDVRISESDDRRVEDGVAHRL